MVGHPVTGLAVSELLRSREPAYSSSPRSAVMLLTPGLACNSPRGSNGSKVAGTPAQAQAERDEEHQVGAEQGSDCVPRLYTPKMLN